MGTIYGCESRAAVRASRRKRSRNGACAASSGGKSLMATGRSRRTSRARYTTPMPPRPSSRSSEYRPASASWKATNVASMAGIVIGAALYLLETRRLRVIIKVGPPQVVGYAVPHHGHRRAFVRDDGGASSRQREAHADRMRAYRTRESVDARVAGRVGRSEHARAATRTGTAAPDHPVRQNLRI